jgi:DNA-binding NarL/FixJ family response regulator
MKFLVIDDHRLYLEGIKAVLAQHLPDVMIMTSNSTDIKSFITMHPDISLILLDLRMPDGGAPYILSELNEHKIPIPVLIVSASENSTDVQLVIDNGAAGYIPKTSSPSELIHAIRSVLAGELYLPDKWHDRIFGNSSHIFVNEAQQEILLSTRLRDVLQLIEKGYSTKEIGRLLTLSENTVYGYVKDLFAKFQVNSRTELVQAAKSLNVFGFK